MNRLLILLLALCSVYAHAADVTATGVTCSATIPASITIDSGSNRLLFFVITEDDDAPGGDVATVGTVAETETFSFLDVSPSRDHTHFAWIWNESAIASMSGTTVVGTEGGGDNHFCWGVVEDADQTAFGAWDFTSYTAASASPAVTSTSTASDYLLVAAIVAESARTIDSYDTLTDQGTVTSTARHGLGSGVGGDGTTTLTLSASGETTITALVFLNVATSNTALRRRRY